MAPSLATRFTGIPFENPFLLASAPPTESDNNILRAFDAGWGGVVCKTIAMHPVVNVRGPKTTFFKATADSREISIRKRPNTALHSSWNWELTSDKPLDWWLPRIEKIKKAHPTKVFVASIMAGSGSDKELSHWQHLAKTCQEAGADALELNLSCPHMDREDMGANIGRNPTLCSVVTVAVKEVAKVPIWAKLTPSSADIVAEASAVFRAGADAVVSSNTFPSLPLIDLESLDFEINVDGKVSIGGLGGPAILPISLAKMSQLTQAFPEKSFSGIGGVSDFVHALNYFLLGCGTVQVCTAAMLDKAIGPSIIKSLTEGMTRFLEERPEGWSSLEDFRGRSRGRVVPHHEIARPTDVEYTGGHDVLGQSPLSSNQSKKRRSQPMSRTVRGGLIQCKNPVNDESVAVSVIQEKALAAHLPMIEEAGKKGVQILCLQEIFNGPYFCPSQAIRWYDAAESVPGPTTEVMSAHAKKHGMAIVVPVYEREQAGVYYNTAAVIDADGKYLGKYRKNHIPDCNPGFYEKFYFRPGNLGYPVFQTQFAKVGVYICYDRHFPEGARALGLNGAEIVFNPSATVAGLSEYLWKLEQPAHAVANGYYLGAINRVGTEAPWNIGEFYGQSYFCDPRGKILVTASRDQSELVVADMDLEVIEEVRRVWQFYRDRRPETYEGLVKL